MSLISLERANQKSLFYVSVNVIILSGQKALLVKRSAKAKSHPGRYCFPGGKIEHDMFDLTNPDRKDGEILLFSDPIWRTARKEVQEEVGLSLAGEYRILDNVFFVREDKIPVIMVRVIATGWAGESVKLESGAFDGSVWASADEAALLNCGSGTAESIQRAVELMHSGF